MLQGGKKPTHLPTPVQGGEEYYLSKRVGTFECGGRLPMANSTEYNTRSVSDVALSSFSFVS